VYAATDTGLSTPLKTVTTDAAGYYGFDSLADGSYLVAPVKLSGGAYTPVSRAVTLAGAPKLVAAFGYASSAGGASAGVSSESGTSASSPVRLSQATAGASRLNLFFTGAIEVDTASDLSRYGVQVNGQEVVPESISYSSGSFVVTLLLPDGSLKVGDQVQVKWNDLRDTRDRALSGQTTLTAK
jgi:hypothetical protein